jgi:hypothetical protein
VISIIKDGRELGWSDAVNMDNAEFYYDTSPGREDTLLGIEEAKGVAGSDLRVFGRDERRLKHYTDRVVITMEAFRRQILGLHRDVQQANASRGTRSAGSSLSPMDLVKFLTPEQLGEAVGGASQAQIETATRQRQETQIAKMAAVGLLNELKLVIGALCDDPTLPPPARRKLEEVLTRFKERGPEVRHPQPEVGSLDELFEEG